MKNLFRSLVLSVSTAAVVLSAMPAAEARDHRRHHVERSNDRVGEAIGAGIIGLALGAIVVGILSEQQTGTSNASENPYKRPRPSPERDFFPIPPRAAYPVEAGYSASLEPWSAGWYRYCEARYRSFNPADGTFTTYGGEKRFCIAD
ncbi:MAG: BA14K family protein [Rhizobiaceae bacterium]|nr:BA14K family protein [Rhizobiaceae bacterium]